MRLVSAIAAVALLSTSAFAQPAQPQFSPERVKADVTFLADDLLEGREAGTRGFDIAAHYVASRFEALGLEPATKDGWYQQVPFVQTRLADKRPVLTIGGKRFEHGEQMLTGPSATETKQSFGDLPVVFVGFGIDKPGQGFDDYAGLDVRGKVVAYLSGFPKGTPSDIGAHLSSEKARMAEARGAVGIVTIPTDESLDRRSWERRVEGYSDPKALTWVGPDGKPWDEAPGIRFSATLGREAAQALFAGAPKSLKSVLADADRKGSKPRGFALNPTLGFERESVHTKLSSPNILAVLPGSDPALRDEYVVLMAHLDHVGVDPHEKGADKIHNGALDNAAGIATMLEAARAFAESGERPKRSILFAAVTAEEKGLLGAEYLAKNPVIPKDKLVGLVNLDMPILLYDFTDVIAFGAEHSTLGPIVERATAAAGVKTSPDPLPAEGLFTRSDHYMFVKEGIPSVFLMTGFGNGGEKAFEGFLKTHYHKPSDEIGLPIDWNAAAKFARINYLIASEIANAPARPRWYADSFFGNAFAPGQTKAGR